MLAATFTLLAVALSRPAAAAAPILNQRFSVTFALTNPCTGEFFVATGTFHIVFSSAAGPSGIDHLNLALNGLAHGVAVSGTRYVFIEDVHEHVNVHGSPPSFFPATIKSVTSFRIIGQGTVQDFSVHLLVHFTVNANGEPTATVVSQRIECGGVPLAG